MARLSKTEAARQLGISRTTLYRLIEHGRLSPTPTGHIDDTELVRVAPQVDAIKERLATSSDSAQERYDTSSDSVQEHHDTPRDRSHIPQLYPHDAQVVTPSDSVQERH